MFALLQQTRLFDVRDPFPHSKGGSICSASNLPLADDARLSQESARDSTSSGAGARLVTKTFQSQTAETSAAGSSCFLMSFCKYL